jgi:AcrR family transcriptional regulator
MARVSAVREQLVEGGIRVLERDGLQALSVRNLAAEAGTSTMAVYTHFGGMTGVIDAIAGESFARFTLALTEVAKTDDPVADFLPDGRPLPRVRTGQSAALPVDVRHLHGVPEPPPRRPHRSRAAPPTASSSRCRFRPCWTW